MAVLKYRDPTTGEWKTLSMSVGDTVPIGTVVEFASDKIPDNWLLCDGRAVSRNVYSELFSVLGTTWGSGDGSTTFNLPSKLGLVTVGKNTNDIDFATLGKKGGEKTHTLSIDEMPAHAHDFRSVLDNDNTQSGGSLPKGSDRQGRNNGWSTYIDWNTGNRAMANTGGDKAHNNLQPYVTSNFIIKAKQSSGLVGDVVDNLTSTSTINALSAKQGKVLNETKLGLYGGALFGELYTTCLEIDLSLANNNITTDDKLYPTTFSVQDKNNKIMARLEGIPRSNGEVQSFWYVRNYNTSGTMTRSSRY